MNKMKLYSGFLHFHTSTGENDILYTISLGKEPGSKTIPIGSNDVILLKDSNSNAMSIIGPLPEKFSISTLKELLGEYYPVFVQAAFDNNPVELCRIDV